MNEATIRTMIGRVVHLTWKASSRSEIRRLFDFVSYGRVLRFTAGEPVQVDALETLEALSPVKAAKLMLTDHLSKGGGDDPASLFPVAERLVDLFPKELAKPEEAIRLLNTDMVRSELQEAIGVAVSGAEGPGVLTWWLVETRGQHREIVPEGGSFAAKLIGWVEVTSP